MFRTDVVARQMTVDRECAKDDKAPIDQFFLYSVVQSIKPNEQNREIRFHPGERRRPASLPLRLPRPFTHRIAPLTS